MAEDKEEKKHPLKITLEWRRIRQVIQVLFLLLFLYLLLGTRQESNTLIPHDFFFRLDPLTGISAMISGREWILSLALGGITLLLTLAAGRAWCGWICPLGTILDWTPSRHSSTNKPEIHPRWRNIRYLLLFTILISVILGSMTLLVFEPITLLFRTISSVVLPVFDMAFTGAATLLYNIDFLQPSIERLDNLVRGSILTGQPFYLPNIAIALVFAGVLALNAIRPRFWCRYLCPLGALLGLVSRITYLKHSVDVSKCTACQRCADICPTGAIDPAKNFAASTTDCILCMDCLKACPTGAMSFRGKPGLAKPHRLDPSRRWFFASIGGALAGALLLKFVPKLGSKSTALIRPPGTSEEQLLSECIRCGECIKVCPTGGLQPGIAARNWEGLWTPALILRLGSCDYSCNSCGQVCPTGAIPELSLTEKRQKVIGAAFIDKERCIPWADGLDCIVCDPLDGEAAIRVQSIG